MPKVGRWLKEHWVLVRQDSEKGDSEYLDVNGHASKLYEAAFYESEDEARAAVAREKASGTFSPCPLIYFLRDIAEFHRDETPDEE